MSAYTKLVEELHDLLYEKNLQIAKLETKCELYRKMLLRQGIDLNSILSNNLAEAEEDKVPAKPVMTLYEFIDRLTGCQYDDRLEFTSRIYPGAKVGSCRWQATLWAKSALSFDVRPIIHYESTKLDQIDSDIDCCLRQKETEVGDLLDILDDMGPAAGPADPVEIKCFRQGAVYIVQLSIASVVIFEDNVVAKQLKF